MDLSSSAWAAIGGGVLLMAWGVVEIIVKSAVFTSGRWLYIVHRGGSSGLYWVAVALKFIGGVVVLAGAFAVQFTSKKQLSDKLDDTTAAAVSASASATASAPPIAQAGVVPTPKHTTPPAATTTASGTKPPSKPGTKK